MASLGLFIVLAPTYAFFVLIGADDPSAYADKLDNPLAGAVVSFPVEPRTAVDTHDAGIASNRVLQRGGKLG
jgi:hypothetical protein